MNTPASHTITVDEAGSRLDAYLTSRFPHLSRTRIQRAIKQGEILLEGKNSKAHAALRVGASISLPVEMTEKTAPIIEQLTPRSDIPLTIVFEDEDILVVNKPTGLLMHPAIPGEQDSLANAAIAHVPGMATVGESWLRPGIMHRLDKDASGLVVLAKNKKAFTALKKQFQTRAAKKEYLVLVEGGPPEDEGTVRLAIGRKANGGRMSARPAIDDGDRPAVTHYEVVTRYMKASLLKVHTETGRTHQIRAHMKALGCPVCGDVLYGAKKPLVPCSRLFLHAAKLGFKHPTTKKMVEFAVELPEELETILTKLQR